jgi:hypothetical protein
MPKDILKIWRKDGFRLTTWDTGRRDYRGQTKIGYRFCDGGKVIFTGEDFCASPLHADDSPESVHALLGFLSCQPGDTDAEYFKDYTPAQMAWAQSYRAELLGLLVSNFEEARHA